MPVFSDVALPSALAERVGCTQTTNIATSLNNDIGSLKALLVSRGSEYGTYDFKMCIRDRSYAYHSNRKPYHPYGSTAYRKRGRVRQGI